MGNQLSGQVLALIPPEFQQLTDLSSVPFQSRSSRLSNRILAWKPVRKLLLAFYDRIFRIYYG
jgi:hypothetical protein